MMRKSVYRKVIFIMLCVALLLLIAIAWKVQVFQILMAVPFFPVINSVLNNSWFCSICCSIIAVYLIYKWQVWYSKRKLKTDFRCNEVIEGVYDGIEEFVKFYQEIPKKEQSDGCKTDEDYHLLRKKNAQVLVDFYSKYKGEVFVANLAMAYDGNDLLLDSI